MEAALFTIRNPCQTPLRARAWVAVPHSVGTRPHERAEPAGRSCSQRPHACVRIPCSLSPGRGSTSPLPAGQKHVPRRGTFHRRDSSLQTPWGRFYPSSYFSLAALGSDDRPDPH
ncbi:hypothetical protein AAFF_G00150240 [Aldrovandia affinis]|uniref:Uncharacterized protein n=1 Tax=Aldrovandia affinis TaxID=143900 RepID=A0AAD7RPE2_9TELE|nr:hypothetical protein AAFF_G00150240 [Aldrovandia affinis]